MQSYRQSLEALDRWFSSIVNAYPGRMQCRLGCASCCYGLWDVSLPDAFLAAEGIRWLPPDVLDAVRGRASEIQRTIRRLAPELAPPYFLDALGEEGIDRIVEAAGSPGCPFLGNGDRCLIYEYRPLACRLEGVPMVDLGDGPFGDWCELNFTDGIPGDARRDLALDYAGLQEMEDSLGERIAVEVLGRQGAGITVFLPSVAAEFESFWRMYLGRALKILQGEP
jgi:Fe-S-cluster containining protein